MRKKLRRPLRSLSLTLMALVTATATMVNATSYSIRIEHIWDDNNNAAGKRPDKIEETVTEIKDSYNKDKDTTGVIKDYEDTGLEAGKNEAAEDQGRYEGTQAADSYDKSTIPDSFGEGENEVRKPSVEVQEPERSDEVKKIEAAVKELGEEPNEDDYTDHEEYTAAKNAYDTKKSEIESDENYAAYSEYMESDGKKNYDAYKKALDAYNAALKEYLKDTAGNMNKTPPDQLSGDHTGDVQNGYNGADKSLYDEAFKKAFADAVMGNGPDYNDQNRAELEAKIRQEIDRVKAEHDGVITGLDKDIKDCDAAIEEYNKQLEDQNSTLTEEEKADIQTKLAAAEEKKATAEAARDNLAKDIAAKVEELLDGTKAGNLWAVEDEVKGLEKETVDGEEIKHPLNYLAEIKQASKDALSAAGYETTQLKITITLKADGRVYVSVDNGESWSGVNTTEPYDPAKDVVDETVFTFLHTLKYTEGDDDTDTDTDRDDDDDDPPPPPEEVVEEPPVPLAPPEEPVEEEEMPEEDVPKTEVPKTGDSSGLWMGSALISGMALLALLKKRDEDAEAEEA